MFVFVYFTKRHTAIFLQLAVLHCIILYDCAKDQWELRRKRGGGEGEAREEPDLHICPTHTIPTLSDLSLTYCMVLPTPCVAIISDISLTQAHICQDHTTTTPMRLHFAGRKLHFISRHTHMGRGIYF